MRKIHFLFSIFIKCSENPNQKKKEEKYKITLFSSRRETKTTHNIQMIAINFEILSTNVMNLLNLIKILSIALQIAIQSKYELCFESLTKPPKKTFNFAHNKDNYISYLLSSHIMPNESIQLNTQQLNKSFHFITKGM